MFGSLVSYEKIFNDVLLMFEALEAILEERVTKSFSSGNIEILFCHN